MALRPYDTLLPIQRSSRSFFDPSWEVTGWTDYNQVFRQMEQQMRDMERNMNQMFQHFNQVFSRLPETKSTWKPDMSREDPSWKRPRYLQTVYRLTAAVLVPIDREFETMRFKDPFITDKDGSRKMELKFDVRQFKPEELHIKTRDNQLTVHARHEDKSDNSMVYREYHRQFSLPEGVNPETMKSILSPEGVLTIEAPIPKALEQPRERILPIEHLK